MTGPESLGDTDEPGIGPKNLGGADELGRGLTAPGRVGVRRWFADLALGGRLALSGGRESWTRTTLTAVGVGLGVALLLLSAAVPNILASRTERISARDDLRLSQSEIKPGDRTLLVSDFDTTYHDRGIRGRVLRAEGPAAPRPPGVAKLPGSGELVVSPELGKLLAAPEGALLRERLGGTIVGTIGDQGLGGPLEYAFYLGSDTITAGDGGARRIDGFGSQYEREGFDPVLLILIVIIFVVLLLPVAVFIGAAVRFGGDRRDRRLAALRLVGADGAMTRRIAAGETLLGTLLGLGVGAVVFLAGRQLVELFTISDMTVFAADVQPTLGLALLIALTVPAAAVAVTLLALRRVVIEPLGVVRHAGATRRRLWWRLAPSALGLALLTPLIGGVSQTGPAANEYQVAGGVVLLLLGVAALLPWLVEAVVARLRGGAVPWQLATRRLQLSSGTSARVVSGIAVASAGAIALQMVFAGIGAGYTTSTGQDPNRADLQFSLRNPAGHAASEAIAARFRDTAGVRSVTSYTTVYATGTTTPAGPDVPPAAGTVLIAGCAALLELADLGRCADGDVFVRQPSGEPGEWPGPGEEVLFGDSEDPDARRWTVPATAPTVAVRPDPMGNMPAILATPGALPAGDLRAGRTEIYVGLDPARPDAIEYARNTAAGISTSMSIYQLTDRQESTRFTTIRRGLYLGAILTMLLIGASILVSTLEQLRDRKRLLAILVAFGARRSTLSWSVLFQTAVPVGLGLALAVGTGIGLGAVLMAMVNRPVRVDWGSIGLIGAVAAGVVVLVTALSLPALWRMMRPDGLRTE
ncbi:membrane protein [Acrocarpospora corrugata]|uniref:Membrane protein n=1 Tax=Acrocarpospora corrugata TaxID=35763 RepID=A0A5M3WDF1_9ACTN|nr:ABC transporter permease [Acrocarpospora corrugata]GES05111.1 membrane protein [Acrocarpospora corrugata]